MAGLFDDLEEDSGGLFDDLLTEPAPAPKPAEPKPVALKDQPDKERSWLEAAGDTALSGAKGVIGLGQAGVGLLNLATGNAVGDALQKYTGYDPKASNEFLSSLQSEKQQQADARVEAADGFVDTLKAAASNPAAVGGMLAESAPSMLAPAGAARAVAAKVFQKGGEAALKAALPKIATVGAVSEGAVTAGQQQEQARQAGRSYSESAPYALAAGAGTALIGKASTLIPGFKDASTALAVAGMGGKAATAREAGKQIAKGMFAEGALQEMPQGAQEQIFQNLGLGKPWDEGVGNAAAMGLVVGGAMGGGANAVSSFAKPPELSVEDALIHALETGQTRPADPAKTVEDVVTGKTPPTDMLTRMGVTPVVGSSENEYAAVAAELTAIDPSLGGVVAGAGTAPGGGLAGPGGSQGDLADLPGGDTGTAGTGAAPGAAGVGARSAALSWTQRPDGTLLVNGDADTVAALTPNLRPIPTTGGLLVGKTRAKEVAQTIDAMRPVPETFQSREEATSFAQKNGLAEKSEAVDTGSGWVIAPAVKQPTIGELNEQAAAVERLNAGIQSSQRIANGTPVELVPDGRSTGVAGVASRVIQAVFDVPVSVVRNLTANGAFYEGRVFLDLEQIEKAGGTPAQQVGRVFGIAGHETEHFFQKSTDPEDVATNAKLEAVIRANLSDSRAPDRRQSEEQALRTKPLPADYGFNEIAADLSGSMWMSPKFWSDLHAVDNGSTARRVFYRFMQATTKFIAVAKGSKLDASVWTNNVDVVRAAYVQAWAERAGRRGPKPAAGATQTGGVAQTQPVLSAKGPQTDSPEFKAWYGEGGLRNPDGTPMVLYHGTTKATAKKIGVFNRSATGAMGSAVYLGDSPEASAGYDQGAMMKVYARGKYLTNKQWTDYVNKHGWKGAEEAARADGWSGVYDTKFENAIAVWDPKDIKSATNNTGAFGQREPTEKEARKAGMTQREAVGAQADGDIRFSQVSVSNTPEGWPEMAGDKVSIVSPAETERFEIIPGEGQNVLNYAILPTTGEYTVLGHVELLVEGGKPTSLLDIEIYSKGDGAGRAAVETITGAFPENKLNISNIVESARGFWAKMGVPEQNRGEGEAYDGTLDARTVAEASRRGAQDRGAAGRPPVSRGEGQDRGAAGAATREGEDGSLTLSQSSGESDNRTAVVVGAKPGEFKWDFTAPGSPSPFALHPSAGPRLQKIGDAVHKILRSKGFEDLARDMFGVKGAVVVPLNGSWEGKPEPSFGLYTDSMTFEQADGLSRMLGMMLAQDATVVTQPTLDSDDVIPGFYIGSAKKLTPKQLQSVVKSAQELGIDYSTSLDGKAVKFLHFGDDAGLNELGTKAIKIAKAAGLSEPVPFTARSNLNEADSYDLDSGEDRASRRSAWLEDGSSGPSDLFRRAVNHVLVPYAKAVGAEGYKFSVQRYAERFGLSEAQRELISRSLAPTNGAKKSTAPFMRLTDEQARRALLIPENNANVSDVLMGLQNASSQQGLIEPGDYSPAASKLIAQAITDEVLFHVNEHGGKSAIGWYDRALKAAKAIYKSVFPKISSDADQSMLFDALLGIASQGNDVFSNSLYAGRMYVLTENGKTLPEAVALLKGSFGGETRAIENNYLKLHELLERNGYSTMRAFFNKKATVGELNAQLRSDRNLWFGGKPLKIEGSARQTVTGWSVFGPKIGSFINNLHGDYSTLTADLWFSRTWNRILGYSFVHAPALEADQYQNFIKSLVAEANFNNGSISKDDPKGYDKDGKPIPRAFGKDATGMSDQSVLDVIDDPAAALKLAEELEKKFRTGGYREKSDLRRAAKNWVENRYQTVAAPRTDVERTFQQETAELAQRMLRKSGMDISIADIQAALWYHEKSLFKKLGVSTKRSEAADYEDAAKKLVATMSEGKLFWNEADERNVIDIAGIKYKGSPEGDLAFSQAADPYARYDGVQIRMPILIEDTGQTAYMRMDAGKALRSLDERMATFERTLECLSR